LAYVSVEDMRIEGVAAQSYPNKWIEDRIALACATVNALTHCFFEKREEYVVKMDGRGHDTLFLPVPPVSTSAIDGVTVDGESVDSEYFEVLMPEFPDGRYNPKLRHLTSIWPKGKSNIVITGDFGFVEADESTPLLIQDVVKRIVMWNLPKIGDADAQKAGQIIRESLRDYSYQLADPSKIPQGFFRDLKVDTILARFQKPAMAVA
jgi:hypothetical protein